MIGEVFDKEKSAIAFEPSSKPVPVEERARLLADPGFGRVFTDHMALIEYDEATAGTMRASPRATRSRWTLHRRCSTTRRKSSRG